MNRRRVVNNMLLFLLLFVAHYPRRLGVSFLSLYRLKVRLNPEMGVAQLEGTPQTSFDQTVCHSGNAQCAEVVANSGEE